MAGVTESITSCQAAINLSIKALESIPSMPSSSSRSAQATFSSLQALPIVDAGILDTLTTLLPILKQSVTSLSLSFKSPVTPDAAIAQLQKVQDEFGRLASCVILATSGERMTYMIEDWKDGILNTGRNITGLLNVLKTSANTSAGSRTAVDDAYLAHTGMVWESIDKMSKQCIRTENESVKKRWKSQAGLMKDALEELQELEETSEEDQDSEEGDDDFDDFDDVLGVSGPKSLDAEERRRVKAAKPLILLYPVLHHTIDRKLSSLALDPDRTYDSLLQAGDALMVAFDDLIAALNPTQDIEDIRQSIKTLSEVSERLIAVIGERLSFSTETNKKNWDTFLQQWRKKLRQEQETYTGEEISMTSLSSALPVNGD